jgi:hypothetical protein
MRRWYSSIFNFQFLISFLGKLFVFLSIKINISNSKYLFCFFEILPTSMLHLVVTLKVHPRQLLSRHLFPTQILNVMMGVEKRINKKLLPFNQSCNRSGPASDRPVQTGQNWPVCWVVFCRSKGEASKNTCFLIFCSCSIDLQEETSCYSHLFVSCPKDENPMSLSREKKIMYLTPDC